MTSSSGSDGRAGPSAVALPLNHEPLGLVRDLAAAFSAAGIRFCHWKSNSAVALSEAGINDLDLLVDEGSGPAAVSTLRSLGFVRGIVPRSRAVPGLSDFFSVDARSGRLVQVQMHEQLVLGDDMTKNYRLPVEAALLASSRVVSVLPVPAPEFEFVVFVLRMAVKHCPLDAVLMGKGRLTGTERSELEYLTSSIDDEELSNVVGEAFPWLEVDQLWALVEVFDAGSSIRQRARAGRLALGLVAPFGRRPRSIDLILRVWRRLLRRWSRHLGAGPGFKRLERGRVIAIIGGDGAGKSTAVARLSDLLSSQFQVETIHMGKPPRSIASRLVRRLMNRLTLDGGAIRAGLGPPLIQALLNVLLVRDRLRLARRAEKLAGEGWLVVSDRYPSPQLASMDGPRRNRLPVGSLERPLIRRLVRWEERSYDRLPQPDLRIVMRVSPDVAVSRRPEQDAEFVHGRALEVFDSEWGDAVVVSADGPVSEVHAAIVAHLWRELGVSGVGIS